MSAGAGRHKLWDGEGLLSVPVPAPVQPLLGEEDRHLAECEHADRRQAGVSVTRGLSEGRGRNVPGSSLLVSPVTVTQYARRQFLQEYKIFNKYLRIISNIVLYIDLGNSKDIYEFLNKR